MPDGSGVARIAAREVPGAQPLARRLGNPPHPRRDALERLRARRGGARPARRPLLPHRHRRARGPRPRPRDRLYGQGYRADDISSIALLPRLPRVEARTNGFAGGGLLRGHFRVRELGDGKLFLDTGQPPYVLVRLREGFVILGLDAEPKTIALYDEMARAWPDKVVPRPQ